MSQLTSDTREVWMAVVYNEDDQRIKEGGEYMTEEAAVKDAHEWVEHYVETCGSYYYARVEHRIVPTYK